MLLTTFYLQLLLALALVNALIVYKYSPLLASLYLPQLALAISSSFTLLALCASGLLWSMKQYWPPNLFWPYFLPMATAFFTLMGMRLLRLALHPFKKRWPLLQPFYGPFLHLISLDVFLLLHPFLHLQLAYPHLNFTFKGLMSGVFVYLLLKTTFGLLQHSWQGLSPQSPLVVVYGLIGAGAVSLASSACIGLF